MPGRTVRNTSGSHLAIWRLAFAGCFLLSAIAYGLLPSRDPLVLAFASVLWPGVALHGRLNGSLLFGGGFGTAGNFLVIVGGAALAWSAAVTAVAALWGQLVRRRRS